MDNNNIKSKLSRRVDRPLGWGIMGGILIIILTLGIVGACAAAENKDGITAVIVIGAIALTILIACVVGYYLKHRGKSLLEEDVAAAEPDSVEESAEAAVVEPEVATEEVADEAAATEEAVAVEEDEAAADQDDYAEEVDYDAVIDEVAATEDATDAVVEEVVAEEATVDEVTDVVVEEPAIEEAVEEVVPEEPAVVITAEEARDTMSDEAALALIEYRTKSPVDGPMCTVNVGMLSASFEAGEEVTLDALQEKGLIPRKQNGYIVLAKGTINKALIVIANDFSADAVKMIVAAGGKAIGC